MIILVGRNVVGSEIINEKEEMVKAHEREARSEKREAVISGAGEGAEETGRIYWGTAPPNPSPSSSLSLII